MLLLLLKETTDQEVDDLNIWLYLKDKFNISNKAWREFLAKAKDFPKLLKIIKRVNDLNASCNLSPTPGDAEGVQVKFEDSLQKQLERIKLKDDIIDISQVQCGQNSNW